ncbi:MAG TPA: VOC family protein [Streptosporangiaceae bacterium]|nr:VOC family protein [Streptosporangiaceae bacterium]
MDRVRHGTLHHVEIWVPHLDRAIISWGWLLDALGYEPFQDWPGGRSWRCGPTYIVLEQSPARTATRHDRCRPGLNHLAFHVESRAMTDELSVDAGQHGWRMLFADQYPFAGGTGHYAAYLENIDGFEVELVAPSMAEEAEQDEPAPAPAAVPVPAVAVPPQAPPVRPSVFRRSVAPDEQDADEVGSATVETAIVGPPTIETATVGPAAVETSTAEPVAVMTVNSGPGVFERSVFERTVPAPSGPAPTSPVHTSPGPASPEGPAPAGAPPVPGAPAADSA